MGKEREVNLRRRHYRTTKLRMPKSFKKPSKIYKPKKPKAHKAAQQEIK